MNEITEPILTPPVKAQPPQTLRSVLLGGVLPLVIFTVAEEVYGTLWGLIAGMAFGVGEIIYEKVKNGKVDGITWLGNGMLLGLGAVSLITKEGMWFKLQPAILEAFMGMFFITSVFYGKPFMVMMATKQGLFAKINPVVEPMLRRHLTGFTLRTGVFFLLHAVLATWAALHWSTRAWIFLKGFGFTGSFVVYGLLEMFWMRRKISRSIAT